MAIKSEFAKLLSIAQEAAIRAGDLLLKSRKDILGVNEENVHDIKVRADKESERIILDYLRSKTLLSILSEESGKLAGSDKQFTWIVDPLDGSMNYLRGIPLCCVSVGLWRGGDPLLGVIYDFNRSELFTGIVGGQALLNGKRISVSTVNQKEKAVLCTGFPADTDYSKKGITAFVQTVRSYRKVRLFGSAALSCAYVAAGRADAYMENGIKLWDVAAGIALVKAAGGTAEYNFKAGKNGSNVKMSNRMLAADIGREVL